MTTTVDYHTDTTPFTLGDTISFQGEDYKVTKVNRVTIGVTRIRDDKPLRIRVEGYPTSELFVKNGDAKDTPEKPSLVPLTSATLRAYDFYDREVFQYGGKEYFVLSVERAKVIVNEMATGKALTLSLSRGLPSALVTFRAATEEEKDKYRGKPVRIGAIVELKEALCRRWNYAVGSLFVVTNVKGTSCRLVPVGGSETGTYLRGIQFSDLTEVQVKKV